jgi:hypothetical protein
MPGMFALLYPSVRQTEQITLSSVLTERTNVGVVAGNRFVNVVNPMDLQAQTGYCG